MLIWLIKEKIYLFRCIKSECHFRLKRQMDLTRMLIFFQTAKSINNQIFFFFEEDQMIKQCESVRIVRKKRCSIDRNPWEEDDLIGDIFLLFSLLMKKKWNDLFRLMWCELDEIDDKWMFRELVDNWKLNEKKTFNRNLLQCHKSINHWNLFPKHPIHLKNQKFSRRIPSHKVFEEILFTISNKFNEKIFERFDMKFRRFREELIV